MLLPYAQPLEPARFLRREKRFTAHVEKDGRRVPVHTNNTGSMLGLLRPGSEVLLSRADNPKRKLKWTLEQARFHGLAVGVNTSVPLRMLQAAWRAGAMPELAGCRGFRREAVRGESRLDALLDTGQDGPAGELWVECKNVTLVEDGTVALFPDAATERGRKHLRELVDAVRSGARAALFFLIQRGDAECFAPAGLVDPEYEDLLYRALDAGVEAWPYRARVTPRGLDLGPRLPFRMR